MGFSTIMVIDLYSLAIVIIIFIQAMSGTERYMLQQKLFLQTLWVTALMLVVDIFSRFDGYPGTYYAVFNQAGNFLIFLFGPALPSLWFLYVYSQVNYDKRVFRRWLRLVLCINAVNVLMLILSQFFGWFYAIGPDNIYRRGPLYLFPVAVTMVLTVSAFTLILVNRKKVDRRHFTSLLLFPVPTLACTVLQIVFYGTSLILNGAALSILIVFITIQNRHMNTDFLTGAYNRKGLDIYIRQKINASTERKTFSAILLDLDDFKAINDSYGHNTGDEVLVASVDLLRTCIRSDDFIARYGGDEFYIILNISSRDGLEAVIGRINGCIEAYNEKGMVPFRLGASMGYAVYDYSWHLTAEAFRSRIDALMYENKRARKAAPMHSEQATSL